MEMLFVGIILIFVVLPIALKIEVNKEVKNKPDPYAPLKPIIAKVNDVHSNKAQYINRARSRGREKEINGLYEELDSAYNKFVTAFNMHGVDLYATQSALKQHKIDSAIMGGAASAIGGVGAGVYAAVKTDDANRRKEENKEYCLNKQEESRSEVFRLAEKVEKLADRIKVIGTL